MPHLDSTLTTIFWVSILVLTGISPVFKSGQIKVYKVKTSPVTKQLDNLDEAIKELERLQERIKQSNKSGAQVFMIKRNKNSIAGDKSVEIKINNPEEEIKILNDVEEKIRQSAVSGSLEKFAIPSKTSTQIHFPTSFSWNVRQDPHPRRLGPMKCFMFAIICGAGGILLLFAANYEQQWALASTNWPTTQGRIIESYSYLDYRLNNRQFVKYSYTVNNKQYISTDLAFNSTWSQGTDDMAKRFPVNSIVTVHYSPDNPCRSCLEIGNVNILGHRFYGAVLCFAVALLLLFIGVTYRQDQSENSNKSLIDW